MRSPMSQLPRPDDGDRQRAGEAARVLSRLLGDDPPRAVAPLHHLSPQVFDLSPKAARAFGALLIERMAATQPTPGRPGGGPEALAAEPGDARALRNLADLLGQAATLLTQVAEASPTPRSVTEDQRRALAELVAEAQDLGFGY